MKKRKTAKLTEEQLQARQESVLWERSKDFVYLGKIGPNKDDPRAVAKYVAQELSGCPGWGMKELFTLIEKRWSLCGDTNPENKQRFLGRMLTALGEYLLNGQPMFDGVYFDAANIKILQPEITVPEIISKLEKLHPGFTRDALEKRVRRLLKPIPREYLKTLPPL